MQQERPLSQRRGFEFSAFGGNRLGIVMIKAPIEITSPALAERLHGALETNVLGREYDLNHQRHELLHQYQGHDWTIICPFDICASSTVAQISKQLKTRCIYLTHEDTSSSSIYELFD